MKFDSKTYLFYKILEQVGEKNVILAKYIVKMLGDFKVEPGSLVTTRSLDDDVVTTSSVYFVPENKDLAISSFSFSTKNTYDHNIELAGLYNGNIFKINMKGITLSSGDFKCNFSITIIDENKGISFFASSAFNPLTSKYGPFFCNYDHDTLDSLICNYNLKIDEILKFDPNVLCRLGIDPDNINFFEFKDINFRNSLSFLDNFFKSLSYDDYLKMISDFNKDNDSYAEYLNERQKDFIKKFYFL